MEGFQERSSNIVHEQEFDDEIDIKEEPIEADEQENGNKDRIELKDIIVSIGNDEENDSFSKEPINETEMKQEILEKIANHHLEIVSNGRNVSAGNSSSNKDSQNHHRHMYRQGRQTFDHLNARSPAHPWSPTHPSNKPYSEAIFKKWSKGTCVYQCKLCHYRTYGDSVEFWKHIKDKHNVTMETYKVYHDPSPCVVTNKITCKLCLKEIQFDYKTLLKHANNQHQIKLLDFYQRFYQEEAERIHRSEMERSRDKRKRTQDIKLENYEISSSSKEKEDTSEIIYCLCRKPERPDMIGCDYCEEWFHPDCLDLSENEVKKLTEIKWRCPMCISKDAKYKELPTKNPTSKSTKFPGITKNFRRSIVNSNARKSKEKLSKNSPSKTKKVPAYMDDPPIIVQLQEQIKAKQANEKKARESQVPTKNPPSKTRIIPERIENPPIFMKEAPKANAVEQQVSSQQQATPTQMVIAKAFLWNSVKRYPAYEYFGKLGLSFMLKDGKAILALFKSNQQMISMVDLGLESLKVVQHFSDVIRLVDYQGRAWSLQMFDENFIKTFPYHLLSMRYSVIKNRKNVSFLIDKGENEDPVKIGDTYHAEIFCGSNFSHMKMIEMKKVKVEPNVSMWHHHLTDYHENVRLLLYGVKSDFTDVPMKEDFDTDCIYLMIKLNGKVVSPPTSKNEVLVNKMEKVENNVVINMTNAKKLVRRQTNNIESQIENNHQIYANTTSKSKDIKPDNPNRENIRNIEAPDKISDYAENPPSKTRKIPESTENPFWISDFRTTHKNISNGFPESTENPFWISDFRTTQTNISNGFYGSPKPSNSKEPQPILGQKLVKNSSENNVIDTNNSTSIIMATTVSKNNQEVVEPKIYKCTIGNCEKSFQKLEEFKLHIKINHTPIRCDGCKRIFDCSREMQTHIFKCNLNPEIRNRIETSLV